MITETITKDTQAASQAFSPDVQVNLEKPQLPAEVQDPSAYRQQLLADPQVRALTDAIDVSDPQTILSFGQAPAEQISRTADTILSGMKSVTQEEANRMLTDLAKLMDKFDPKDFEPSSEKKGLAGMFAKMRSKWDSIFAKYEDLGKDVDRIAQDLRLYTNDIQKANADLSKQYEAEIAYFKELEKYIAAGTAGIQEIKDFAVSVQNDTALPEQEKSVRLSQLSMMQELLEQRVYDLQTAEAVAIQACPMIQTMQYANFNLLRKINSSFIVTLPVFKQCLIQAIQLKRQEVQAKSIQALDDKTNELLLRNAQNTSAQSVNIARMAGGASVKLETLKQSYEAITNGIRETKEITAQIADQRKSDSAELEHLKKEMRETKL